MALDDVLQQLQEAGRDVRTLQRLRAAVDAEMEAGQWDRMKIRWVTSWTEEGEPVIGPEDEVWIIQRGKDGHAAECQCRNCTTTAEPFVSQKEETPADPPAPPVPTYEPWEPTRCPVCWQFAVDRRGKCHSSVCDRSAGADQRRREARAAELDAGTQPRKR